MIKAEQMHRALCGGRFHFEDHRAPYAVVVQLPDGRMVYADAADDRVHPKTGEPCVVVTTVRAAVPTDFDAVGERIFEANENPRTTREAILQLVMDLSAQRDVLRGLVEAGLTGWSHEDLAVAKIICGWKADEIADSTAEDWPCSFSHHAHKDRAEAVECAKQRR